MPLIQDAISSLLGGDATEDWQSKLRQASFRGVPFAVLAEEATHGRRQAIHEYPYRDTAWIEDMGRGTRRLMLRGFIVQDSQVYGGGDVINQRSALIEACEASGPGTLTHPTLGELTVSIPAGGLRIGGSAENGRVFEFTLTAFESGLRVFAVTNSTVAGVGVRTNYLKLVSTTVLSVMARVKGEIRSVTQAVNTVKSTIAFWTNMVDRTVSEVTNISNTLKSTFGNTRYGRYSKGTTGGSSSGVTGTLLEKDTEDYGSLVNQTMAASVMDRKDISDKIATLNSSSSVDDFIQRTSDVVLAVLNTVGGVNERIAALEKMAAVQSNAYWQAEADQQVAASIQTLIIVLCSGAMASAASEANPSSSNELKEIMDAVCQQLDASLIRAGDRGDDDIYNGLLDLRGAFTQAMEKKGENLPDMMLVRTARPLPALTLANRLYQDASRSAELIQGTSVPHPAFMPTSMQVLRK